MNNSLLLRFLLVIFSPLIIISLSYFLFLSKPEIFSKSFEKNKYQDYYFSFKKVVTNKNPLYPELIFEDVVLKNKKYDNEIIISGEKIINKNLSNKALFIFKV